MLKNPTLPTGFNFSDRATGHATSKLLKGFRRIVVAPWFDLDNEPEEQQ